MITFYKSVKNIAKIILPKMVNIIPKTASNPKKNNESIPQDKYHSAFPLLSVFSFVALKDLSWVSFILKNGCQNVRKKT